MEPTSHFEFFKKTRNSTTINPGLPTLVVSSLESRKSPTMANPKLGLAKDLFEDMGRKVADAQQAGDEDDTKVVDEIESLCMNCHANVGTAGQFYEHFC